MLFPPSERKLRTSDALHGCQEPSSSSWPCFFCGPETLRYAPCSLLCAPPDTLEQDPPQLQTISDKLRPVRKPGWESPSTVHRLLLPATASNPELCKTLLSAKVLGYATPVLIGWQKVWDLPVMHGGSHLGKITVCGRREPHHIKPTALTRQPQGRACLPRRASSREQQRDCHPPRRV